MALIGHRRVVVERQRRGADPDRVAGVVLERRRVLADRGDRVAGRSRDGLAAAAQADGDEVGQRVDAGVGVEVERGVVDGERPEHDVAERQVFDVDLDGQRVVVPDPDLRCSEAADLVVDVLDLADVDELDGGLDVVAAADDVGPQRVGDTGAGRGHAERTHEVGAELGVDAVELVLGSGRAATAREHVAGLNRDPVQVAGLLGEAGEVDVLVEERGDVPGQAEQLDLGPHRGGADDRRRGGQAGDRLGSDVDLVGSVQVRVLGLDRRVLVDRRRAVPVSRCGRASRRTGRGCCRCRAWRKPCRRHRTSARLRPWRGRCRRRRRDRCRSWRHTPSPSVSRCHRRAGQR